MRASKTVLLAIVLVTTSVKLFSQTAEEWKQLGNTELDIDNYDKAIEYYKKAIEVDSTYFDAYHNLGLAFSYTLDLNKAIEYYSKAIAINDTAADTFFALGGVYSEKEDYDKAIEMFKKGIALKPNSPEEHYYLALFYQEKGSIIYAMQYVKKAAQLGDTLAQQYFISNEMGWEDNFVKPDYDQIKSNIENPQAYSPYSTAHDAKQVNALLDQETPTKEELEELVSLLNISLSVEPFNCRYLYYQSIAYDALDKPIEVNKNIKKIQNILDAVISTGDGLLQETALHVIAVHSEYDYLFLNDLSMHSQALVNVGYDVLYLSPNEDGLEELWFDINQALNYLGKSFE